MKHLFVILTLSTVLLSQPKYVRSVFKSTRLINISTTEQLYANTFEYRIGHRFGDANSGFTNMFGMDLGANTLLGLDFGITDDFKMGFSRANIGKNFGLNMQYRIARQSGDDSMPVTFSFVLGSNYLSQKKANEAFTAGELLISRKFTPDLSLQISPFIMHIAPSEDLDYESLIIYGTGISGRYKVTKTTAIIFEWSPMFNRQDFNDELSPTRDFEYDTFALAYNIESAGHTFQLIISNSQESSMLTSKFGSIYAPFEKHFYFGFNITRLFLL